MGLYYYHSDDPNEDDGEFTGDEYYYSTSSLLKFLDKLKIDKNKNLDYFLEDYNLYEYPIEVKRRNMEKFDRLTDRGYRLNFVTGEFKLSS